MFPCRSERAGVGPGCLSRTRLTEGASINRSLVALGNVISALGENGGNAFHNAVNGAKT